MAVTPPTKQRRRKRSPLGKLASLFSDEPLSALAAAYPYKLGHEQRVPTAGAPAWMGGQWVRSCDLAILQHIACTPHSISGLLHAHTLCLLDMFLLEGQKAIYPAAKFALIECQENRAIDKDCILHWQNCTIENCTMACLTIICKIESTACPVVVVKIVLLLAVLTNEHARRLLCTRTGGCTAAIDNSEHTQRHP
eukprot:17130-Heterococcus_DN1.PRE.3